MVYKRLPDPKISEPYLKKKFQTKFWLKQYWKWWWWWWWWWQWLGIRITCLTWAIAPPASGQFCSVLSNFVRILRIFRRRACSARKMMTITIIMTMLVMIRAMTIIMIRMLMIMVFDMPCFWGATIRCRCRFKNLATIFRGTCSTAFMPPIVVMMMRLMLMMLMTMITMMMGMMMQWKMSNGNKCEKCGLGNW